MADYFEIDFLDVESSKSGDAIALRYELNNQTSIHVVDGGFQATGKSVVDHIKKYYGDPSFIDHVVATHPDGDHASGLRTVLEEFDVGQLWMLRPWLYAGEIIDRFSRYTSVENLRQRLRQDYPNITALEEIADSKGIPIFEPFQGKSIGAFTVLAPSKGRYLDLVVDSDRTPQSVSAEQVGELSLESWFKKATAKLIEFAKAAWGEEVFSAEGTSAENEMSIVQFARICDQRILLTADAGREGLEEAAAYAPSAGLILPGIDRIQVPHHGSRRNVSTELLDQWLGQRLPSPPGQAEQTFTAIISSAKADEDHPRQSVVRAFIHRGAKVVTTEGKTIRTSYSAPERNGWVPVTPVTYPETQEED